jgi:hypothetical protein
MSYARSIVVMRGKPDGTGVSIVRNAVLFGGFVLVLSSVCLAGDDERYPAYDFEPKVIVSAPEGASAAESPQRDSKYPAAYFEPEVIVRASEESPQPDPRYPAAYFEPKVIYQER